jgi:hypothetical protein
MWDRREAAAELTFWRKPIVDTGMSHCPDQGSLNKRTPKWLRPTAAQNRSTSRIHDGNVHYGVYPSSDNAALKDVC